MSGKNRIVNFAKRGNSVFFQREDGNDRLYHEATDSSIDRLVQVTELLEDTGEVRFETLGSAHNFDAWVMTVNYLVDDTVKALRRMDYRRRERFIELLRGEICFSCGGDKPCYCWNDD